MAGYIGARSVSLSTTVATAQDVTATDTTPEVTIINNTHEDTDGGREGKVIFKGQQSGGEESTLAEIQGSHDGTADDEKGDLIFKTNDGSDGASPTERMRIDSAGTVTITNASNDTQLLLESTDADASSGPVLELFRNSASPADNDLGGAIEFYSENDADEKIRYQGIFTYTPDVSDGSEDGAFQHYIIKDGTQIQRMEHSPTETVFNQDSADVDFRVESDGNANMFFVNAADDKIGIGVSDPDAVLDISGGTNKLGILRVVQRASGAAAYGLDVGLDPSTGDPVFSRIVNDTVTEAMRIVRSTGNVAVGQSTGIGNVQSSVNGSALGASGYCMFSRGGGTAGYFNRNSDDGVLISLYGQATAEGNISVSGSTVSYNGGHLSRWSQLSDNTKDTSIVKGTVMTNLDKMAVWTHAAKKVGDDILDVDGTVIGQETEAKDAWTENNEQLNCMAVSSVEGDANVAGVFVNWDEDDDIFTNDMNVAMTGDMVIRIAKGVTVARGDLLMSAGDGTAKPQDDDIVRSKTIAKVTSTNVSHTYDDESYLVPCVLMAC